MGQRVIADNWSFQSIASLVERGLDTDEVIPLEDLGALERTAAPIPQAILELEALFDFLSDMTLRDQLLVDERYAYTWGGPGGTFGSLLASSVVKLHPFLEVEDKLEDPRRQFVRQLTINDRLASMQRENEAAWAESGTSRHPYAAQLVWGGAGMLARAWVTETAYTPHPMRRRLFERAKVIIPGPVNALSEYQGTLAKHRATLYHASSGGLYGSLVVLPAVPAMVLQESQSLSDVFKIAFQVRDRLGPLRAWLSQYQDALTAGEFDEIAPHAKRLAGLGRDVERALGIKNKDAATLNVGLSWFKLNFKMDPARILDRLDRVHVHASSLVFAPNGGEGLRKLLGFFGHRHSELGRSVYDHFSARGTTATT